MDLRAWARQLFPLHSFCDSPTLFSTFTFCVSARRSTSGSAPNLILQMRRCRQKIHDVLDLMVTKLQADIDRKREERADLLATRKTHEALFLAAKNAFEEDDFAVKIGAIQPLLTTVATVREEVGKLNDGYKHNNGGNLFSGNVMPARINQCKNGYTKVETKEKLEQTSADGFTPWSPADLARGGRANWPTGCVVLSAGDRSYWNPSTPGGVQSHSRPYLLTTVATVRAEVEKLSDGYKEGGEFDFGKCYAL